MPTVKGRSPISLQLMLCCLMLAAACGSATGESLATPSPSLALTPFQTLEPGSAATAGPAADLENVVKPTPTLFLYVIQQNDTLYGLATQHGTSVDAILAANPGLDPRFLAIGQEIIIPVGEEGAPIDVVPTPTAVPVALDASQCYTNAAGQLTCFLLLHNDQDEALENISASLQLFSSDGDLLSSVDAVAPLNLLEPGAALPLTAFVDNPPQDWSFAQGGLQAAFLATDVEERYVGVEFAYKEIDIADDGLQAAVSGSLQLEAGRKANSVWVLAVAYDAADEVVGVRRWEGDGSENDFEFWVYSLGPQIDRVELLAEARP